MSKNKPFAIFVAIVGGLLLIVAIIMSITSKDKPNDNDAEASIVVTPTALPIKDTKINGYDVIGTWYSDRPDGDILTLGNDSSFESSVWLLLGGTYSINGNSIVLVDKTGSTKNITYKTQDNIHTLKFENGANSHIYYRTKEEAELSSEREAREREERKTLIDSAALQILTTGEWISQSGNAKVSFSDTEYTHEYIHENQENIVQTFKYTITEIKETDSGYELKWEADNIENGRHMSANDAVILIKGDDNYSLSCSAFDYMENSYYKTVSIVFEQPN